MAHRISILVTFDLPEAPSETQLSRLEDEMEGSVDVYSGVLGPEARLADGAVMSHDYPGAWDYIAKK